VPTDGLRGLRGRHTRVPRGHIRIEPIEPQRSSRGAGNPGDAAGNGSVVPLPDESTTLVPLPSLNQPAPGPPAAALRRLNRSEPPFLDFTRTRP